MKIYCTWRAEKRYPRPRLKDLRQLIALLADAAGAGLTDRALSISFLSAKEMSRVNWDFLRHKGDTDVICFDYRSGGEDGHVSGECSEPDDDPAVDLIVCPAVADREAAKRGLPYSSEVTLYLAHGLLHAAGYDDLKPELKRKMRRAEKRVLGKVLPELSEVFPVPQIEKWD